MDYTEQFIRLNCSLMSDYKMMKLNADMKCMGLGLYLETILFLRKQQEYKHDFNELDLLADQWGATVENLQHLIKDFDLFLITEDGYFRCLYLDEVMGYQSKLSEQRAAAGSKGGRSSKKSTVKASAKATASTASAIGRGRINEGKNGDTSCVDNNGEAYMKSDDTPCVYDNGEAYLKSDDTPCMDNNGEVYMKSGDAFCVDNNGEAYMESSGVPCMDNNKEVYLKSSGAWRRSSVCAARRAARGSPLPCGRDKCRRETCCSAPAFCCTNDKAPAECRTFCGGLAVMKER